MHLSMKQRKQLKQQLLERRKELEHRLLQDDFHGLESSMREALRELSMYDNHPADSGTELFERGKDLALQEQLEQQLEEVIIALENMETGRYGICVVCGKQIPYGRLEAIPWTSCCVEHAPNQKLPADRPVEEEVLHPPFGRTSLDGRSDETQFDGEDAWQIVERYGNSDSPAMAEDREAPDYDALYIEADENEGFVEPIENFLATDLTGKERMVVRGSAYRKYLEQNEGDPGLEVIDAAAAFDDDGELR